MTKSTLEVLSQCWLLPLTTEAISQESEMRLVYLDIQWLAGLPL